MRWFTQVLCSRPEVAVYHFHLIPHSNCSMWQGQYYVGNFETQESLCPCCVPAVTPFQSRHRFFSSKFDGHRIRRGVCSVEIPWLGMGVTTRRFWICENRGTVDHRIAIHYATWGKPSPLIDNHTSTTWA